MDRETEEETFRAVGHRGHHCFSSGVRGRQPQQTYSPRITSQPRSTLRSGNPHELDTEAVAEEDLVD